jgi:hypothetical protein
MPCEVGWRPEDGGCMFLQNIYVLGLWVVSVSFELCEEICDNMTEMMWYWTADLPFLCISSE